MALLSLFSKSKSISTLQALPQGSFTIDASGRIIASTLPHEFPRSEIQGVGETLLEMFRSALTLQIPLREVTLHYSAMKVTARELRGGAMVFLAPKNLPR